MSQRVRIMIGIGAAVAFAIVTAVVTAMIETPVFGRSIPPEWWSWPALVVASVLGGALVAVSLPGDGSAPVADRRGVWGAVGTFFAVGCPVCNKLALLALGSAGALNWFAPVQPFLALASIGLLAWALVRRLRAPAVCTLPVASSGAPPAPAVAPR